MINIDLSSENLEIIFKIFILDMRSMFKSKKLLKVKIQETDLDIY